MSLVHNLQGEEWRERLVQDRLSHHIAHCPLGANCGDRICKYFNWFQRHYSQCVRQGTAHYVVLVCAKR